ncbi:hypothetical protein QI089_09510 [Staphylococcus saprophyticus]|uniref:hypothetical protein n=1 Tax=Staphylococcus saprophyticus TaxID=29385 RepID=UPI001887C338|nr:hypothetical protein [Staphylococcus saprophyticus]MBF2780115.1 hypothetical protein [Staphylococcus saprophyticus]MDW4357191.1 hypothetical protein [Staphylococcus saprophyticus]MEB7677510.1 hypothetical protein [Staphylococcus saprophyticus]
MKQLNEVLEVLEYVELGNKIQSCMDYLVTEIEAVEETREWAIKNNEFRLQQEINNAWKSYYVTLSILKSIREDNERMNDEIVMLVKREREKSASVQSANSTDNA